MWLVTTVLDNIYVYVCHLFKMDIFITTIKVEKSVFASHSEAPYVPYPAYSPFQK